MPITVHPLLKHVSPRSRCCAGFLMNWCRLGTYNVVLFVSLEQASVLRVSVGTGGVPIKAEQEAASAGPGLGWPRCLHGGPNSCLSVPLSLVRQC